MLYTKYENASAIKKVYYVPHVKGDIDPGMMSLCVECKIFSVKLTKQL